MIARAGLVAPDEPACATRWSSPARRSPVLSTEALHQRLAWLARNAPAQPSHRPLRPPPPAPARLAPPARARRPGAAHPAARAGHGPCLLIRLDSESARLEAETARLTSAAIGQQVTAAAAAAALDTRIGATPGASGSPFPPLAASTSSLQQLPGVTAVSVTYRPDGTLAASLAATRVEDINRLLLGLQRLGYRVTATTRPGTSGQMIADLTLRSAE
jgi:hypothetical protein